MAGRFIQFLLLGLVMMTGCNPDVFVDEKESLKISVNEYEFPDTGDTLILSLNKEYWYILDVVYTNENGVYSEGNITKGGKTQHSVRMKMTDFGEIWIDQAFGGFKVIRDSYDTLKVITFPNLATHECTLAIVLATGMETVELKFTQQESQGYIMDRIEWDDEFSEVSYTEQLDSNKGFKRVINLYAPTLEGKGIYSSEMMKILNTDSIKLPIPDPYPVDGKLTFSGSILKLIPDVNSYEIDMDLSHPTDTLVNIVGYFTHFRIYARHVTNDNVNICFSSSFHSRIPDLR